MFDNVIFEAPSWNGKRTAALVCPEFRSANDAREFMREADVEMRRRKFEAVVGPMQGDTWGAYRVVLWSDGSPTFAGEPVSKPVELEAFMRAGYSIVETHFSAVATSESYVPPSNGSSEASIVHWDGRDAEGLLAEAHGLVAQAFSKAPFFRNIPVERFVAALAPILSKVDPRFVLSAHAGDGHPVGFALAYPDPIRRSAVVLKTYASTVPGIGRRMANIIHATAFDDGFREVVHALMRDGIVSANQSRKFGGVPFRRYALMGKLL